MRKIKKNERLVIHDDAETFLLHISNGSVRTLINYMEKIKLLDQEITYDMANKICSNISFHYFEDYTRLVLSGESKLNDAIHILFILNDQGYSVLDILDNYFLFVKDALTISRCHDGHLDTPRFYRSASPAKNLQKENVSTLSEAIDQIGAPYHDAPAVIPAETINLGGDVASVDGADKSWSDDARVTSLYGHSYSSP